MTDNTAELQTSFDWSGPPDAERKFAEFDAANPGLWALFETFALERIGRGFEHYGARDILHRIRWESDFNEAGESGFKINNIWSPWYARKFHRAHPEHTGFFRNRAAKADAE